MSNSSDGNATEVDPWSCGWPDEEAFNNTLANVPTLWIPFIMWPIYISMCTIGGILTILVQLSDKTRTTTNIYLMSITIADICSVWLSLQQYHDQTESRSEAWDSFKSFPASANWRGLGTYLQLVSVWVSDWTLVIFQLERLISTTDPLKFRAVFTVKRAKIAVACLLGFSGLWNVEYLVSGYYGLAHNYDSPPWLMTWDAVMLSVEAIRGIIIWLTLTAGNVALVITLNKHAENRKKLSTKAQDSGNSNFLLLFGSSMLFMITQFPYNIYTMLMTAGNQPYCSYHWTAKQDATTWPVVVVIQGINYSCQFLVFYSTSAKFRQQVEVIVNNMLKRIGLGKLVGRKRGLKPAASYNSQASTKKMIPSESQASTKRMIASDSSATVTSAV